MKKLIICLFFAVFSISLVSAKQIKLLAIGNSFSEDAVENYLCDLVKANGDTIIIGNMYIGGCLLERHYNNSVTNSTDYSFRKIENGVLSRTSGITLREAFENEKWDYVSFQQVSQNSGIYETYFPYLDSLIAYAKKHIANPNLKIILHMTWAYAQNSTHSGFVNYGNDQRRMFCSIVETTQRVARKIDAEMIVPSGTAIQNARTSSLGDVFNRDGYHLELTYGRYTVACVWFEKLFGISAIGSRFKPVNISSYQARVAQYAAHYACRNPWVVTSLANLK